MKIFVLEICCLMQGIGRRLTGSVGVSLRWALPRDANNSIQRAFRIKSGSTLPSGVGNAALDGARLLSLREINEAGRSDRMERYAIKNRIYSDRYS